MRISLLQTAPELGDVEANLACLHERLGHVTGSDLAVTAELAVHGYHLGLLQDVEALPSTDDRISGLGVHGPAVVAGFVEAGGHHQYNSAALVDGAAGDGAVQVQRKLYLPSYRSWEEHKHFRPGGRLRRFDVRGARAAVIICNDLWQPAVPWLAAHGGAEVLITIANSSESTAAVSVRRMWDILLVHAAVTLQAYVVFVNRCGVEGGTRFWGRSRVVGPDGESLVLAGEDPEVASVELDLQALRRYRRQWPLLGESRFDLVARETSRLAGDGD